MTGPRITVARLRTAMAVAGLEFDDDELALILSVVGRNRAALDAIRAASPSNEVQPAWTFSPLAPGMEVRATALPDAAPHEGEIARLGARLRSGELTCTELTRRTLAGLRAHDPALHCVITLTEDRALAQAAVLDAEAARGAWRGPLHGIPWGVKDLFAVAGHPTTWGAAPYRDQHIDADAAVVRRLDAAGAVLVAKLTTGELAVNDTWFGGQTRTPWDVEQGSSGSSAGPGSAVAAGLVPFAIGTETLGSIVSPSARCGCSSLRPTFGRISRAGGMALSWSMDKPGPMCRTVADAALVFDAVVGPTPGGEEDAAVVDQPWALPGALTVSGWRVGIDVKGFESAPEMAHVPDELRALGIELVPIELPQEPALELLPILFTEGAAAFDVLTRSDDIGLLANQASTGWPSIFRAARLVPAVDYINATRLRTSLMRAMHAAVEGLDAWVHPSHVGMHLVVTNLTGHPAVVCPTAALDGADGAPGSVTFSGQLYDEARVLALAAAWQATTAHHLRRPPHYAGI